MIMTRDSFPKKGFTILELIIIIGIIAILTSVTVLVLNPAERLRQARDASRIVDLRAVNDAVKFYGVYGGLSYGSSLVLYVSLPDTALTGNATSTCPNMGLPALSGGWSYQCVSGANLRKVDGLGWIPVNLSGLPPGSPLPALPVDPVNTASGGSYYTYAVGSWELTAVMESEKYGGSGSIAATDGGSASGLFEIGSNLALTPASNEGRKTFVSNSGSKVHASDADFGGGTNSGTAVSGTGAAGSVGLANVLNTATDVTTGQGGTAQASGSYSENRAPVYAFNDVLSGDTSVAWLSNTMPAWISVDLGSQQTIGRVKIYPRDLEGARYPKDMQFYGSNDNVNWTLISSFTFANNASAHWETFDFSNVVAYRYHKVNVSTNYGAAEVGISEIEMYAYGYSSSGVFTSSVIDTGQSSTFTTLSYTAATPSGTSLTADVRAGDTAVPDGSWTSWQTGIASGGSLSALGAKRYVQYRANLSTSNSANTSSLDDITINYTY